MPDYARSSWALLVSFCLHAFVLSLVFTVSSASTEASPVPPRDDWVGETVEVEQLLAGPVRHAGPSAPAAAAAARAENADESAGSPPSQAQQPAAPKEPPPVPEKPVVEQKVATQSPQGASPKSRGAESAKAAPAGKPAEDPAEALSRRIFDYRPKASSAPENEAHATAPAAGGATKVGAEGEAKGVRDLARAFTRAIPAANTRDPAWNRLPLGDAGTVRVTITIRADGMLEATPHGEPRDHLERLIQRTVLALQGGRFAVSRPERGSETLVIDVTLSTRPIDEGPLMLGFEPPRRGRRGKAYFQLPTGRFVEAFVAVE